MIVASIHVERLLITLALMLLSSAPARYSGLIAGRHVVISPGPRTHRRPRRYDRRAYDLGRPIASDALGVAVLRRLSASFADLLRHCEGCLTSAPSISVTVRRDADRH
jgi:hypothetical protein